jgi:hypothetical protein
VNTQRLLSPAAAAAVASGKKKHTLSFLLSPVSLVADARVSPLALCAFISRLLNNEPSDAALM